MPVVTKYLDVRTRGKGTYEVSAAVHRIVAASGLSSGTATVFVRHTSCSLVIMENADSSARTDLHAYYDRLVREDEPYFLHTCEGSDDMPSHIRMTLTGCSEVVPFAEGRLLLGTWQGIFLFEHRRLPHTRQIVVTLSGE
jgi:secondary thiamine-phosphate synthase enzyme